MTRDGLDGALRGVRGLVLDADGVIVLKGAPLPGSVQAIQALPYVMTVVLLAGFVGRARMPKALGVPYVKER